MNCCSTCQGDAAHDQCCSPSSLIIIVHSAVTLLIRHLYCCNIAKSAFQHSATSIISLSQGICCSRISKSSKGLHICQIIKGFCLIHPIQFDIAPTHQLLLITLIINLSNLKPFFPQPTVVHDIHQEICSSKGLLMPRH